MNNSKAVQQLVYDVIDELNQGLPENDKLKKSASTELYGEGGKLDSLTLVRLIILTEEKIADELGYVITLADERAMSQQRSPFKTVERLIDYINLLLTEDDRE